MEYLRSTLETVAEKLKEEWEHISLKFSSSSEDLCQEKLLAKRSLKRKAKRPLRERTSKFRELSPKDRLVQDARSSLSNKTLVFPSQPQQQHSQESRFEAATSSQSDAAPNVALYLNLDSEICVLDTDVRVVGELVFKLDVRGDSIAPSKSTTRGDIIIPSFKPCKRSSSRAYLRNVVEDLSDEVFMAMHRKYEALEKRLRIREHELFKHEQYKQQVEQEKIEHAVINKLSTSARGSLSNLFASSGDASDPPASLVASQLGSAVSLESLAAVSRSRVSVFSVSAPVPLLQADEGYPCRLIFKRGAAYYSWLKNGMVENFDPNLQLSEEQRIIAAYIARTLSLEYDSKNYSLSTEQNRERKRTDKPYVKRAIRQFWCSSALKVELTKRDFAKSIKSSGGQFKKL